MGPPLAPMAGLSRGVSGSLTSRTTPAPHLQTLRSPRGFFARRWAAEAVMGTVVSPVVLTRRASASGAIMRAK